MLSPFASRDRALRASDQDRERLAVALKDHAADGRLSVEELDERLGTCYSARTVGELESLLWDLPPARPSPPATIARPRPPRSAFRTALVVLGVTLTLLVLPQLVVGAVGLAFAAAAIVAFAAFALVPLALLVGVVYVVVRAVRAADARQVR